MKLSNSVSFILGQKLKGIKMKLRKLNKKMLRRIKE